MTFGVISTDAIGEPIGYSGSLIQGTFTLYYRGVLDRSLIIEGGSLVIWAPKTARAAEMINFRHFFQSTFSLYR